MDIIHLFDGYHTLMRIAATRAHGEYTFHKINNYPNYEIHYFVKEDETTPGKINDFMRSGHAIRCEKGKMKSEKRKAKSEEEVKKMHADILVLLGNMQDSP